MTGDTIALISGLADTWRSDLSVSPDVTLVAVR